MGKGHKPRPFSNYKDYINNWSEINWGEQKIRCCYCNSVIDKQKLIDYPDSYVKHSDGTVECKKCNFL